MFDQLVKTQNDSLKQENNLIRSTIRRVTNFINGHKNEREIQELNKDLQSLLNILETQRNLISSFESTLEQTQLLYENKLEQSLQNARLSSNKPVVGNYLAELVVKEENEVERLQSELKAKVALAAKEISEYKTIQIHKNAEMLQGMNLVPSKSPSLHKSGARINETKKNKYLAPL